MPDRHKFPINYTDCYSIRRGANSVKQASGGGQDLTEPTCEQAAVVSIGDAARLIGVSRAVLRLWERERLILPRRSSGRHRVYSAADLRRLRQIVQLRRVDRLNAAAIRRELGTAEAPGTTDPVPPEPHLGMRLRALRIDRNWSLAEVAAKAALSISFLSAVERGLSSISVGNLFKLADVYGTTVPGLTADHEPTPRSLVHPHDRPRFVAAQGRVVIEDLISFRGALEAQRIEILPGGGSEDAYSHPGEEFVYVLAGRLHFWIDEAELHRLNGGDSLYFRSSRLHRWRNEGDSSATVLWINAPVVDEPSENRNRRQQAARRR